MENKNLVVLVLVGVVILIGVLAVTMLSQDKGTQSSARNRATTASINQQAQRQKASRNTPVVARQAVKTGVNVVTDNVKTSVRIVE